MKLSEINRLLDAGFTHDEIMSLSTESTENPQDEKPTSVQNEKPADEKKQDSVSDEKPGADQQTENKPDPISELKDLFADLKKSNDELKKTIQESNLKKDSFGGQLENLDKQVDDIMTSIITGQEKKGD